MSYFVRFLLLCCTVALAIPTYANALNERDAVVSRQTGKLQIRVHYPITGNARVDADVADWAHQAVDTFQNTYGEEPDLGVPYELETTYSTTRSTPSVLSIVWKTASYTGGAHGNQTVMGETFRKADGSQVMLGDLFTGEGYQETLFDIVRGQMVARGPYSQTGYYENADQLVADTFDPAAFYVTGDPALVLAYATYTLAPYAAGPQEFTIPFSELADILKPEYIEG